VPRAEDHLDLAGGAVPEPHPDYLRRRATHEPALAEVVVLGDDCEPTVTGVTPYGFVVGSLEVELADVSRVWIKVGEAAHEARREVVVEEELQGGARAVPLRGRIGDEPALAVSRKGESGANVLTLEVREVVEDLVLAHAPGEVVEDVVDGDAEPADARLPAPFPRLDGDPLAVVHALRLGRHAGRGKNGEAYKPVVSWLANADREAASTL
jgi:hypothetical protein